MSKISWLLSSTVFVGLAGGAAEAEVATLETPAAPPGEINVAGGDEPAISADNGRIELRASRESEGEFLAGAGSFALPLGHSFGFQADGLIGTFEGSFVGGAGAHLFSRDPDVGLVGLYSDLGFVDVEGAGIIGRTAFEGELYLGQGTLSVLTGVQYGDVGDGFFSMESVTYYPRDNLALSIGHQYLPDGLGHSGNLAGEWLVADDRNLSLFSEVSLSDGDEIGVTLGVRMYFGPRKSLIRRHREDHLPDHFSLFMQAASSGVAAHRSQEEEPSLE